MQNKLAKSSNLRKHNLILDPVTDLCINCNEPPAGTEPPGTLDTLSKLELLTAAGNKIPPVVMLFAKPLVIVPITPLLHKF